MTGGITAPIHVVIDLLKDKIPKESPKGAAYKAAEEGEVLHSGPSLSVAGNTGGTSAQLQTMAQKLNNDIADTFIDLQKNAYDPPTSQKSEETAAIPTKFSEQLKDKRSSGSIVAAPADSGSVLPGPAVPTKARTVKM